VFLTFDNTQEKWSWEAINMMISIFLDRVTSPGFAVV